MTLLAFIAGSVIGPLLSKATIDIYSAAFPDREYSVLIDSCAPLKSARLLLRNVDTGKLIADSKISWLNETTVIVKNTGKKTIPKPVISINALPFGSEKIEPLHAVIYSSSIEMSRKATVARSDSFFRVALEQMNPNDFVWLEANFAAPISYVIELHGIGVTAAVARAPGCSNPRAKYTDPGLAAQTFSYIGKSCETKDGKISCWFETAKIEFNIPDDAAPGARISEQYIIDRD